MVAGSRKQEQIRNPATADLTAVRDTSSTAKWVLVIVVCLLAFGLPAVYFAYIGEGCLAFLIALVPVVSFLIWWIDKNTSLVGRKGT